MKKFYLILEFVLLYGSLPAQYFFTGEVKDPHGDKLQNGYILVQSTGSSVSPGPFGEFEIISQRAEDTLTLSFDGYEPYTTAVRANQYLQVTLNKPAIPDNPVNKSIKCVYGSNSISFTGNMNRASFGIVQRFVNMGYAVPSEAVQIGELLNYFDFYHEDPEKNEVFHCSPALLSCPWNASHKLLCLNICAAKMDLQRIPGVNLVLLIDASGSMDLPNKLPIVKSGIRLLIDNLRDIDKVSLVSFGGRVHGLLEGVPGSQKEKITRAVQQLSPEGSTPGEEGIALAYEIARRQYIQGGNNRIVLITDGDITGESGKEKELEDFVAGQSRSGISLHCIGVGMSNDQDSRLPALAQKGHGGFAYAGDEQEAERLLARQLTPASLIVANGVSITADFDTALVKEYRLIGYDNQKNISDDSSFHLQGGAICSGHSLSALFELTPNPNATGRDTLAEITIHYCLPGQKTGKTADFICPNKTVSFDKAAGNLKKAVCLAMLGMKLRDTADTAPIAWSDIEKMAKKNFPGNDCMDKEYTELVAKAMKIYAPRSRARP